MRGVTALFDCPRIPDKIPPKSFLCFRVHEITTDQMSLVLYIIDDLICLSVCLHAYKALF